MPTPARKETTDELLARMRATYGGAPASEPATAPAPAPAPTPVAKPKQEPGGILGQAVGLFKGRKEQIDRAAGYANGGLVGAHWSQNQDLVNQEKTQRWAAEDLLKKAQSEGTRSGRQALHSTAGQALLNHQKQWGFAQGGKIKGPGTPTSDSIPAQVQETGEPIKVSTEERIVSAKQEQVLMRIAEMLGFESVDAMFESLTGVPVGPTIQGGQLAAATGADLDDPVKRGIALMKSQKTPQQPAPPASKVYEGVGDGFLAGTRATIQGAGDDAEAAAKAGNYGAAVGHVGRGALAGVVGLADDAMRGAKVLLDPAANALKTFATGDSTPASPTPAPGASAINPAAAAPAPAPSPAPTMPAPVVEQAPAAQAATRPAGPKMFSNVEGGVVDDSASARRDQTSGGRSVQQIYENMVRNRLISDATDPTITDPNVRAEAQKGLGLLTGAQSAQADTAQKEALLKQTQTIEAMRGKLLDPNTPPEERQRMLEAIRAINGKGQGGSYKVATTSTPNPNGFGPNLQQAWAINEETGEIQNVEERARAAAGPKVISPAQKAQLESALKERGISFADYAKANNIVIK